MTTSLSPRLCTFCLRHPSACACITRDDGKRVLVPAPVAQATWAVGTARFFKRVKLRTENFVHHVSFAEIEFPCGRCHGPGAAGAHGLCRECYEVYEEA